MIDSEREGGRLNKIYTIRATASSLIIIRTSQELMRQAFLRCGSERPSPPKLPLTCWRTEGSSGPEVFLPPHMILYVFLITYRPISANLPFLGIVGVSQIERNARFREPCPESFVGVFIIQLSCGDCQPFVDSDERFTTRNGKYRAIVG